MKEKNEGTSVSKNERNSIIEMVKKYEKKGRKEWGKLTSWHHLKDTATEEVIIIPIWKNYDPLEINKE